MSSFNGENLFGSGAHRSNWADLGVDVQNEAFAGQSGEFVIVHGTRARRGQVTGTLRAATIDALHVLCEAVEYYVRDGGSYTWVDTFAVPWYEVRLASFTRRGPVLKTIGSSPEFLQDYTATLEQLQP